MLFKELLFPFPPKMKSEAPTTDKPQMTMSIPTHSLTLSKRPKKAVDSRPVKIMTAPVKRRIKLAEFD